LKKGLKRITRLIVIIAVIFLFYKLFLTPQGYTSDVKLAKDFFQNLQTSTACDTYFLDETKDLCESFQSMMDGQTYEITGVVSMNQTVLVTISNDDLSVTFTVHFARINASGPSHYLYPYYYLIDHVE
jgi:hypothetical protein